MLLPLGDGFNTGKVTSRKKTDGKVLETAHSNPILDSTEYIPDGGEAEYSTNIIAENMYTQCDIDGNQYLIMDGIIDFKKDANAVLMNDMYQVVKGLKYLRKPAKGWHMCVNWRN